MPRRRGWNGNSPETPEDARRVLLEAARLCIDRLGMAKTSLQDVAQEAGVTRQTVYRYFANTDDLFLSAAALAGGGLHERLRRRAQREKGLAFQIAECVVFAVTEIPKDAHLGALLKGDGAVELPFMLTLGFVREEIIFLAGGQPGLTDRQLDDLAELLLRLLHSFLHEAGAERTERQLRAAVRGWVVPVLESYLN